MRKFRFLLAPIAAAMASAILAACAVGPDGTLSPASAAGIPCRLQRVSNGRVTGLQFAF